MAWDLDQHIDEGKTECMMAALAQKNNSIQYSMCQLKIVKIGDYSFEKVLLKIANDDS